ncbi:hypothetical protein NIES22_08780 [Calothrix brevissima NIES-22]|nr:hypothetical protein NIES22_08780 [Calothrix brevissima NIES-22]
MFSNISVCNQSTLVNFFYGSSVKVRFKEIVNCPSKPPESALQI